MRELRTLLARAREPGPYILVGHSFGGENMRLYAYTSPRVVAGFSRVYRPLPEELAHLSTNGQCIVACRSYHVIQHDQPDVVVEAIKRVVAAVRQHRLLSGPSSPARECIGYA